MTLFDPRAMWARPYRPEPCVSGAACRMTSRGAEVVDVGVVAVAGEQQVAMGEHRALRPAGGAAGVEHPGFVIGVAGHGRERVAIKQRRVILGAGDENRRHCPDAGSRQRVGDLGRGEAQPGLQVGHDPGHLARMQLAVDRHRRQAGPPHRVQRRQELRTVLHGERHAGAGRQPVPAAQRTGHAGGVTFELAIRQPAAIPRDCGMIGELPGRVVQGAREVHGA